MDFTNVISKCVLIDSRLNRLITLRHKGTRRVSSYILPAFVHSPIPHRTEVKGMHPNSHIHRIPGHPKQVQGCVSSIYPGLRLPRMSICAISHEQAYSLDGGAVTQRLRSHLLTCREDNTDLKRDKLLHPKNMKQTLLLAQTVVPGDTHTL
jgi:hypothetical protein